MTNFDEWKGAATIEDMLDMSNLEHYQTHRFFAFYCPKCPARDYCDYSSADDSCRVIFCRWASQEAAQRN